MSFIKTYLLVILFLLFKNVNAQDQAVMTIASKVAEIEEGEMTQIVFSLSETSQERLTITVKCSGVAMRGVDYQMPKGYTDQSDIVNITFPIDTRQIAISVFGLEDDVLEPTEISTFTIVDIVGASSGNNHNIVLNPETSTTDIDIKNIGSEPVVSLQSDMLLVDEGSEFKIYSNVSLPVTIQDIEVKIKVSTKSTCTKDDYYSESLQTSFVSTIKAGDLSSDIPLEVLATLDNLVENKEDLVFEIESVYPDYIEIGSNSDAIVAINSNDLPPTADDISYTTSQYLGFYFNSEDFKLMAYDGREVSFISISTLFSEEDGYLELDGNKIIGDKEIDLDQLNRLKFTPYNNIVGEMPVFSFNVYDNYNNKSVLNYWASAYVLDKNVATDVLVELNFDDNQIQQDQEIKYELIVKNTGDNDAYNVVVNNTLGKGLSIISIDVPSGDYEIENNSFKWTNNVIAIDEEIKIIVTAKGVKGGFWNNYANINIDNYDLNLSDNSDNEQYVVKGFVIPNVFSPNGDGINDYWEIEGLEGMRIDLTLFNRWGQEIYKTSNYKNDFSANGFSGGTYFYNIRVYSENEFLKDYHGYLTVINK